MEDMIGKFPKLRYSYHDVHNTEKFPDLEEGEKLENMGKKGPLVRPIMETM